MRAPQSITLRCFYVLIFFLLVSTPPSVARPYFGFKPNKPPPVRAEDPYRVLGVSPSATMDEIKKAYRQKAKETHPDKNDSEEADDQFRKIVAAFEQLNDPNERANYDRQRRFQQQEQQRKQQQEQRQRQQYQQKNKQRRQQEEKRRQQERKRKQQEEEEKGRRQQQREQLRQAVKESQRHVLRLSSLAEFQSAGIISAQGRKYTKHFLGVFVANRFMEQVADDDVMFPYPFAGKGPNGVDWQDVIQTVKVRYNKETELTKFYGAPPSPKTKGSKPRPYLVFGKAGDVASKFQVFRPPRWDLSNPHGQWKGWVEKLLVTEATIVNEHHSSVKLFLANDNLDDDSSARRRNPKLLQTLSSGQAVHLSLHLGDRIWVVDGRVDQYPGSNWNPTLLSKHPNSPAIFAEYVVNGGAPIIIEENHCYDLSFHCPSWVSTPHRPQCRQQAEFMHHICAATCGVCHQPSQTSSRKDNNSQIGSMLAYAVFHAPIHHWPWGLRGIAQLLRNLADDWNDVWTLRRTVLSVFFLGGIIFGINLILLANTVVAATVWENVYLDLWDMAWVCSAGALVMGWCLLTYDFDMLSAKRHEWLHVLRWHLDAVFGLVAVGFLLSIAFQLLHSWATKKTWTHLQQQRLWIAVMSMAALCCGVVAMMIILMALDQDRNDPWQAVLVLHKVLVVGLLSSGVVAAASIRPFLKLSWNFRHGLVLILVDLLAYVSLEWISEQHRHFWRDFDHVVQLRMNVAMPFAIVGLVLACVGSYALVERIDNDILTLRRRVAMGRAKTKME